MPRNRKLRPINETRRPDGKMTSETAARLLRRRGGLNSAKRRREQGILKAHMQMMCYRSALSRLALSKADSKCSVCRSLSERVTRYLASLDAAVGELSEAEKRIAG